MERLLNGFQTAPGDYKDAIESKIKEFQTRRIVERIWKKDASLWLSGKSNGKEREIIDRLGWLDLPFTMASRIEEIKKKGDQLRNHGFRHIVLLGMGGSSLAAEVFASLATNYRLGDSKVDFRLIDSTHPVEIARVESGIDIEHTIFIVSRNSGTNQETISLFNYFFEKVSRLTRKPGDHFISITDAGTPLEKMSRDLGFKQIFLAPPDVGGRFSALSHFGLLPAALVGIDIALLIDEGKRAAEECKGETEENPALLIAATLSALYEHGIDKIAFITDELTSHLADWLEQLIAESTGKDGKGILPIIDEPFSQGIKYKEPRLFVAISLKANKGSTQKDHDQTQRLLESLGKQNPIMRIEIRYPTEIAAQMFLWEFAIAAVCSQLGVNAFDQPDVQLAKDLARKAIQGEVGFGNGDQRTLLKCRKISELEPHIGKLLSNAKSGDYFAIQAFLARSEDFVRNAQQLRLKVLREYGIASTFGFGPRFLHSTGQLHKGGPPNGYFLQVIDQPSVDMAIPNTNMTFAKLIESQALGDYLALKKRERQIIRASIGS
ncbi:MAG: hypothetical protein ACUVQ7_07840 [bacterium]